MTGDALMARGHSIRAMTFAVWCLLCLIATASADQQLPNVPQAVDEIIAACAILPMNTLKAPLSSKLEEFLRQSLETKSAKFSVLTDLLARLPTDTEKGIEHITDPRARSFFIGHYFNCIGQQTSLKLKSWNIALVDGI
jgi:hypothetical protein